MHTHICNLTLRWLTGADCLDVATEGYSIMLTGNRWSGKWKVGGTYVGDPL